uniref:PHD-type domain-containing protein n=1 Tax=Parastrongyloides trichosuri TaxID=131310 RepID=A0A0N4ZU24_PARTI
MVECPMDPFTQGPEEYVRNEVTTTMGIILEDIGFSGVTVEALNELTALFENYFCTLSKRTCNYANLANRAEPSINDVLLSLKTMHNKVSEISDFVKQIDMPKRNGCHDMPICVKREDVVSRKHVVKEKTPESETNKVVEEENVAPVERNEENQKITNEINVEKKTKSKFLSLFKDKKVTELGFEIATIKKSKPPEQGKLESKNHVEESVKIKVSKRDQLKLETSKPSIAISKSPKVPEQASASNRPTLPVASNLSMLNNLSDINGQAMLKQLLVNYGAASMLSMSTIQNETAIQQLNILAQCGFFTQYISDTISSFHKNATNQTDETLQKLFTGSKINIPHQTQNVQPPQQQQLHNVSINKNSSKDDSINATIENVLRSVKATPSSIPPTPIKVNSVKKQYKIKDDHQSKPATDFSGLKFDTPTSSIPKITAPRLDSTNRLNDSSFLNISSTFPLAESTPKNKHINISKELIKPLIPPKSINEIKPSENSSVVETDKEREKREKRERKEKKREKKRRKKEERERLLQNMDTKIDDSKLTNSLSRGMLPLSIDVKVGDPCEGPSGTSSTYTPVEKKLPIKLTFKRANSSVTSPTVTTTTPLTSPLIVDNKCAYSPVLNKSLNDDNTINEEFKNKAKILNNSINDSCNTIITKHHDDKIKKSMGESDNLNAEKKKHKKEKEKSIIKSDVSMIPSSSSASLPTTNPDMLRSKIKRKDKDKKKGDKSTPEAPATLVVGSFNDNGSDYLRVLKEKMAKEHKIQTPNSNNVIMNKEKVKEVHITDKEESPSKRAVTPLSFSRPGSGPLDIEKEEKGKSQVKNILNNFGVSPQKNKDKKEKKKKSSDIPFGTIKGVKQPSLNIMNSKIFSSVKEGPSNIIEDQIPRKIVPPSTEPPTRNIMGNGINGGEDDAETLWICPKCHVAYNEDAEMVGCDKCESWYHFHCVGLIVAPAEHESWFCEDCLKKESTKDRKRKNSKDLNKISSFKKMKRSDRPQ